MVGSRLGCGRIIAGTTPESREAGGAPRPRAARRETLLVPAAARASPCRAIAPASSCRRASRPSRRRAPPPPAAGYGHRRERLDLVGGRRLRDLDEQRGPLGAALAVEDDLVLRRAALRDRKSTRLNSSHITISY